MIDIALLVYVPDPFAVQQSHYLLREPDGSSRVLKPKELSKYPELIMTFDVPALVDDLRRLNLAPPPRIVDIGDALRLIVGRSKDDGGESAWSFWTEFARWSEHKRDASTFELLVTSKAERPDPPELRRILDAALHAVRQMWLDLVSRLEKADELNRLINVEWSLQSLFAYRQYRGVRVDGRGAADLLERVSAEKYAAYREVAELLNRSPSGLNFWNIHPFLEVTDVAHLADVSPGGRLQDAFEVAAPNSKFAAAFLALVKASRDQMVVRRALGGSERFHPIFGVFGTITGRILVSDPHLQQLRRAYRSLVVPDAHMRLVYLDYSQFEPGVLAGLCGDERLTADYNAGDLYAALAATLLGDPKLRPVAKRVFLAFLYGMSADRVARLLAGGAAENQRLAELSSKIEAFFSAYPNFAVFRDSQRTKLLDRGFVESLDGNRRYRSRRGPLSAKEQRWALNHTVQATASLIFKEALILIQQEFGAEAIILPMHDAVLLQFEDDSDFDDKVTRASELMVQAFSRRIPTVDARITSGTFSG